MVREFYERLDSPLNLDPPKLTHGVVQLTFHGDWGDDQVPRPNSGGRIVFDNGSNWELSFSVVMTQTVVNCDGSRTCRVFYMPDP
jgi:hypothetical protein